MNSPNNIDYTITCNGLDLGDPELNARSLALGYDGVEPRLIVRGYELTNRDARYQKNVSVGDIIAEEGMGPVLSEKRDNLLIQAIVANRKGLTLSDRGSNYSARAGEPSDERAASTIYYATSNVARLGLWHLPAALFMLANLSQYGWNHNLRFHVSC